MKNTIKNCLVIVSLVFLCGCGTEKSEVPEIEQIKSICELSTIECVYNNVAKGTKTKGEGISHIGEKERKFWIEYQGYVKLGIDLSKVEMKINGENVEITLPDAEIQSVGIVDETFTEESVILSQDSFWNKNKITADEQKTIIAQAQETMCKKVKSNESIMKKSTERAKTLIENYINQLGKATRVMYHITWK